LPSLASLPNKLRAPDEARGRMAKSPNGTRRAYPLILEDVMRPMSRLLVPTDFSDCAERSLLYAVELAKELNARLTLLHVYRVPTYPVPDGGAAYLQPDSLALFLARIDDALARLKAIVVTDNDDIPVELRAEEGVPAEEIVRIAEDGNYDAIVIGTHGRGGLRHMIMGSVAERVVRAAPCPVITIHSSDQAAAGPSPAPL
jgi:nucleotide-binding universal stress UspA family protein